MNKTLPLRPGEEVIAAGRTMLPSGLVNARLSYVRVTSIRICVLEHHGLSADVILEIPLGSVLDLKTPGDHIEITYTDEGGQTAELTLPSLAAAAETALHSAVAAVGARSPGGSAG